MLDDVGNVGKYMWHGGAHHVGFDVHDAVAVPEVIGPNTVFCVDVGMGMIRPADRPLFARGVMLGLAAMPVGLIAGGLVCGLSLPVCLRQNLPSLLWPSSCSSARGRYLIE